MSSTGRRPLTVVALAIAIGLAAAASPWASASPDGLERVAEEQGFVDERTVPAVQRDAPLRGYAVPGIENPRVATGLAGFAGTLLVLSLGCGAAAVLRRRGRGARDPTFPG
jgi:hypothetical protein